MGPYFLTTSDENYYCFWRFIKQICRYKSLKENWGKMRNKKEGKLPVQKILHRRHLVMRGK